MNDLDKYQKQALEAYSYSAEAQTAHIALSNAIAIEIVTCLKELNEHLVVVNQNLNRIATQLEDGAIKVIQ